MCGREGGREGAKLIHGVYSYTSLSAKKNSIQSALYLMFTLCTGFQMMLKSNTKFLLFASVQ